MKTFINVLYRKILYKIPLKWLLVLLVVFALGFASFSSAELVLTNTSNITKRFDSDVYTSNADLFCVVLNSCNNMSAGLVFLVSSDDVGRGQAFDLGFADTTTPQGFNPGLGYCNTNGYFLFASSSTCDITLNEYNFSEYTSLQCQTEYNLIPVESVDSNYCTTNNLCPSCPVCPSGGSGRSNVYINDILHVGAPNIFMNISEEIDRDYAYTLGGNNMNIDVVGYNVDYDKIDTIIENQSYKPTGEDFQRIIGLLGPYTKIIVFFVFLFIVWAWIKKPFKSKKL